MRYLLPILVLLACACSSTQTKYVVKLPTQQPESGSIAIQFTREADGVIVTLDGELAFQGSEVRTLTIRNVAVGYAELAIAANGIQHTSKAWVSPGQTTTVPIASGPAGKPAHPVVQASLTVLSILITRAAAIWLF